MHQALQLPFDIPRVLIPTADLNKIRLPSAQETNEVKASLINQVIRDNVRQLLAVTAIKIRPAGSLPLIIWGPYVHFILSQS